MAEDTRSMNPSSAPNGDVTRNRPYRRSSVRQEPNAAASSSTPWNEGPADQLEMDSIPDRNADASRVHSTADLIPGDQLRATGYTQSTVVRRQNLGIWDVASVVLNKMVGTGIYTTPGQVLRLTGSKGVSTFLWVVGGVYTALCLTIYLELGSQFPHNGGELIYLSRTMQPGLLWALMFSTFFIMIANTTGNAIAFARLVMIAASPNYKEGEDLNPYVVKLIAVNVLSFVCLLHYFSGRLGLLLNKTLALYKVCLLITVFFAMIWVTTTETSTPGLGKAPEQLPATPLSNLTAFVSVLYSFTGWENANYVAGEIICESDKGPAKTLRRGAYTAVGIVTLLYFLVSLLYYTAFTYCDIVATLDLGMALNLGPLAFKPHGLSLEILFALSAFGNMIAVVYTSAKVKQSIARQRVLPFWRFLERDINSPKGGLLLHWIATTVLIAITPVNSDGYTFIIGLYTYGQIVVVTFTTVGFTYYMCFRKLSDLETKVVLLKSNLLRWTIATIVILANILVLGTGAAQTERLLMPGGQSSGDLPCNIKDNGASTVPRWHWPAIVFPIFVFGAVYWSIMRCLMARKGKQNDQSTFPVKTWGSRLGIAVKVYEVPTGARMEPLLSSKAWQNFIANSSTNEWAQSLSLARNEAIMDGTRRRVDVKLSKAPATLARVWNLVGQWLEKNTMGTRDAMGDGVAR